MKTMILAIVAVLAFGVGSAFAGDGDGYSATTLFTSIPGQQSVLAQSQIAPAPTQTASVGHPLTVANTYVTSSRTGAWLFAPDMNGGSDN